MNKITKYCKKVIQNFGCDHDYNFVRNIYGDEINAHNGMRSEWRCIKCGHIQYRDDLHTRGTLCEELDNIYDNYYKNEYDNWFNVHSESINNMKKIMREQAYKGCCFAHIVLFIDRNTNDKNYYEQWLDSQGLKYEYVCLTKVEDVQLKQYEYIIRWKN